MSNIILGSKKPFKLAAVIGRFQLKHIGHALLFNKAASVAENVIVLIGSAFQPRTPKNPFTFAERSEMVAEHFRSSPLTQGVHLTVKPIRDNVYSNSAWLSQAQQAITEEVKRLGIGGWQDSVVKTEVNVCIVGHKKDLTTSYLDWFPQYPLIAIDEFRLQLDATSIRSILFTQPDKLPMLGNIVPDDVSKFLETFIKTEAYTRLVREYAYYRDYRKQWGDGPFVTVDALIKKAGHVCLIKRADDPGMDLWALPGGFLEKDELIFDGCIREVGEETSIDVPPGLFKGSLVKEKVFDAVDRSLRGRIITHCHMFDLDGKDKNLGLPSIKASSDAKEAKWFPINEVLNMSEVMFEDHLDMYKYMLGL